MEIGAIPNNAIYQKPNEVASAKAQQSQPITDKDKADISASNQIPHDEYISSEESSKKPSGLYKVVPDENGKSKILYEDPNKCTANTDKVDREIENLKEKKEQLEQQIRSAFGDDKKVKELENKLESIKNELRQKDNDAYRRQNASIS